MATSVEEIQALEDRLAELKKVEEENQTPAKVRDRLTSVLDGDDTHLYPSTSLIRDVKVLAEAIAGPKEDAPKRKKKGSKVADDAPVEADVAPGV